MTIIIPTLGSPSVGATMNSLNPQVKRGDEVLVVADGEWDPILNNACALHQKASKARWTHEATRERIGFYGHGVRNWILDGGVWTDYVWSIDDDDIALPGALDVIHEGIFQYPGRWFIYQMVGGKNSHFPGVTVPITPGMLTRGNVGTPCIVAPSSAKARWGTAPSDHGDGYFGDYDYAVALQEELGDPVWVPVTVACIRP